jgi:hypothetical protein
LRFLKQGRIVAAALSLGALLAAPAHAATIANPENCAPQPTLAQSFAPWGDLGFYTPVPNAGLENGSTGWTLLNGAKVIAGNEPWKIGGATHSHALELPAGAVAITAPLCIDETYPHFRFFVRNAGLVTGALKIDVLYLDSSGKIVNTKPYDYKAALPAWTPTGLVGIDVFTPKTTVAAAPVAFRFTAMGPGTRFQLDDVYVDPRMAR